MRRYNIRGKPFDQGKRGKTAAAIAYNREEAAPRIVASGRDREAERIIAIAHEAGIAVVEDPALAALLDTAKTGDFIPQWCWEAAAGILAVVLAREDR
jgi:flagellar biosynthesis protein